MSFWRYAAIIYDSVWVRNGTENAKLASLVSVPIDAAIMPVMIRLWSRQASPLCRYVLSSASSGSCRCNYHAGFYSNKKDSEDKFESILR